MTDLHHAGIVDDNINRPERSFGCRHQVINLGRVAQVTWVRKHARAQFARPLMDAIGSRRDGNSCACRREQFRTGKTNPARTAASCHQRCLVSYTRH